MRCNGQPAVCILLSVQRQDHALIVENKKTPASPAHPGKIIHRAEPCRSVRVFHNGRVVIRELFYDILPYLIPLL